MLQTIKQTIFLQAILSPVKFQKALKISETTKLLRYSTLARPTHSTAADGRDTYLYAKEAIRIEENSGRV